MSKINVNIPSNFISSSTVDELFDISDDLDELADRIRIEAEEKSRAEELIRYCKTPCYRYKA